MGLWLGVGVRVSVGVRVGARVRRGRGAQPLLCRASLSGFVPHKRATHEQCAHVQRALSKPRLARVSSRSSRVDLC